jgi:hypothetical protein
VELLMTAVSLPGDMTPLRRCCPDHGDWRTLAEHLVAEITALPAGDVLQELARAKSAVTAFGLSETEQLGVAELMARHQLLLATGDVRDIARLDPERHVRGERTT